MTSSRPLDVAIVWHMHQPYYRSACSGSFDMPWARMHALKDYLDMLDALSAYPALHQTFNLVPSLVEQLQDYASGVYHDVYWEHTLTPASELSPEEREFVLKRMCERSDHPRARSHPRYLELARKRESLMPSGWEACAQAFSVGELRDLQVWFNLAWFGRRALSDEAVGGLVQRDRDFQEQDKRLLAQCQASLIGKVLPAYRDAASRGQVELTTSPYFHPILPLLCDSDLARVATPDLRLPPRRFAHPEDAAEQLGSALAMHTSVFGDTPHGMWCSEMAVGETVIPLLIEKGIGWTISDESVLARSLNGVAPVTRDVGPATAFGTPYWPYRLVRDAGEMTIVFRDHTLSDLIGFTYRSWDSRAAAADLLSRLRELQRTLPTLVPAPVRSSGARGAFAGRRLRSTVPLVVIALDGENAWEYYPNEGHDFLGYLYEGLSADDSLRSVTVSEHLRSSPPAFSLDWLHTGSWVFSDLTTWCGTHAQNTAWEQLHRARDLVSSSRDATAGERRRETAGSRVTDHAVEAAWRHVLISEGSDWFWWFGEHHHTDLDAVWDREFRLRLQEVYRLLGEPSPSELLLPLLETPSPVLPTMPTGMISPVIDGALGNLDNWEQAGRMALVPSSTMQPTTMIQVNDVRFGWQGERLCLLVVPDPAYLCEGLWIELSARRGGESPEPLVRVTLQDAGKVELAALSEDVPLDSVQAVWKDVVELSLPARLSTGVDEAHFALSVRIGLGQMAPLEFSSAGAVVPGVGSS